MKTLRKQDTRIPRRPLLWLAAALLFTLPPMFGTLPSWVPLLFLIALAAKFWMEPRGYRLRSLIWKLVLVALILFLLFFSYGSLRGMEPGVSLIVLLTSVKILEAHTAREFHIMIMVAWVLCLCGFFLFSEFGNRTLSPYCLHFTARRAHPVSLRSIIRLLAAGSHRRQTYRPGHAPYYLAVPLFSAHQYRAPISDRAATWRSGWLLRPALTRERCIFG